MEIVLRKFELLKSLVHSQSLSEANACYLPGVQSQVAFAAFSLPESLLHSISLNNLKSTANQIIDGGFDYFDAMRKEAHVRLTTPAVTIVVARTDTKSELISQTQALRRQLTQVQEHNLRLTYVIREIQSRYQTVASLPPNAIKARHALDLSEIYSILAGLSIVLEGN